MTGFQDFFKNTDEIKDNVMSFNECEIMLQEMQGSNCIKQNFFDYVYDKISQNTKNRFVEKSNNSIDIILNQQPSIKVIPICQNIDKDNLAIESEVDQAVDIIKQNKFQYVYFVYPKNDNFDKHIEIKTPHLDESCSDYRIKLIPYSLDTLKQNRGCKKWRETL